MPDDQWRRRRFRRARPPACRAFCRRPRSAAPAAGRRVMCRFGTPAGIVNSAAEQAGAAGGINVGRRQFIGDAIAGRHSPARLRRAPIVERSPPPRHCVVRAVTIDRLAAPMLMTLTARRFR